MYDSGIGYMMATASGLGCMMTTAGDLGCMMTTSVLHVPILIQFTEAVRLHGVAPNLPELGLRLEINSPSTNLPSYHQSLQRTWVLPVSEKGTLQLELLPSSYLHSPRTYKVRFYRLGNTQADFSQTWEVPPIYKYRILECVRSHEPFDELPVNVFSGIEVPGYEGWSFEAGRLIWSANSPAPGEAYSLRYLLPLSLGDIVKPE
jgi:hypothetical protein